MPHWEGPFPCKPPSSMDGVPMPSLESIVRRDRDALIGKVARLRDALTSAKEKLALYRKAHGGEYLGGVEYSELMRRIDAALSE